MCEETKSCSSCQWITIIPFHKGSADEPETILICKEIPLCAFEDSNMLMWICEGLMWVCEDWEMFTTVKQITAAQWPPFLLPAHLTCAYLTKFIFQMCFCFQVGH